MTRPPMCTSTPGSDADADRVHRHERGGDRRSKEFKASHGALKGKSAARMAEMLGISTRTVERSRAVLASENEAIKERVLNGEMTINAAYTAIREERQWRESL